MSQRMGIAHGRVRRWASRALGLRPREQGVVPFIRGLFLRFALLNAAFVAPMLLGSEAPPPLRAAGAVALVLVLVWWAWGEARGRMPVWGLLLEVPALFVVALGTGDPPMTLGFMYVSLNYRAMHGTIPAAAAVGVGYLTAHLAAVAVAAGMGTAGPATALDSPVVLVQVPGFALTVVVMRALVGIARRRERELDGQRTLAATGGSLAAARRVEDVADAAVSGGADLASPYGEADALIALHEGSEWVVRAATEPALVGRSLRLDAAAGLRSGQQGGLGADAARAVGLPWAAATVAPLEERGEVEGWILLRPVDETLSLLATGLAAQVVLALARVRAVEEVEAREARFRSLVASASDVIRVIDGEGAIVYESPAVRRVLGQDHEQLLGQSAYALVHPDDAPALEELLPEVHEARGEPVPARLRMRHADGTWRHVEGVARDLFEDPAVGGLVINYRDVTERIELEEELRRQALHDALTGLANRDLFFDQVALALERRRRTGGPVGVLYLDVDGFKSINDDGGHAAGDEMLRVLADRLRSATRASDSCARLGGDEFAVLVEGLAGPGDLDDVAQRVSAALEAPLEFGERAWSPHVSVGMALSDGSESADALVHRADAAMYEAKRGRKDRRARGVAVGTPRRRTTS